MPPALPRGMTRPFHGTRILILSPEAQEIEHALKRAGYGRLQRVARSTDLLPKAPHPPIDLVILDLSLPGAADAALRLDRSPDPPALLFVGSDIPSALSGPILGFPHGDFLRAPVDPTELLLRVRSLLRQRWQHARMEQHAEGEGRFRLVTSRLERQRLELLDRLARAVEYKDDETGEHPWRVGRISARIAVALGLPEELAEMLELAAPLHDIGKIAVPDAVLLKPGELAVWEGELLRSHTVVGGQLLAGSASPVLQMAEAIALSHHERWDGRGYPAGLLRGSITLPARIVAVADAYDAMSFDRLYRDALPPVRVVEEIRAGAGQGYDPRVVDALLEEALPRIASEGLSRTA